MPAARKGSTKKSADSGSATATKRRKQSRKVAEEVAEEAEDEDVEEAEEAASTSNRRRITPEIAQRAAEMREEGATWQEVIDETGFNGAQLRPHIARLTEAKIDTLEDSPESVAEHRNEGYAWYAMAISLDKTIAEIKEMAEEGGAEVEGRNYRSNGAEADAEEDEDEDEDEDDEEEEEEDDEPAPAKRRSSKSTAAKKSAPAKTAAKTNGKTASKGTTAASKRRKNPSKAA